MSRSKALRGASKSLIHACSVLALALAGGCGADETPDGAISETPQPELTFFHRGIALTAAKDREALGRLMGHPSATTMLDAAAPGYVWLSTNPDEEAEAIRHHDAFVKALREQAAPLAAAARALGGVSDLRPLAFCDFWPFNLDFPYLHDHIITGNDRSQGGTWVIADVSIPDYFTRSFDERASSVVMRPGSQAIRLFADANHTGRSTRLIPPPAGQCALYNLTTNYWTTPCPFPPFTGCNMSWNDTVTSSRPD
jgi:hypothetical protein